MPLCMYDVRTTNIVHFTSVHCILLYSAHTLRHIYSEYFFLFHFFFLSPILLTENENTQHVIFLLELSARRKKMKIDYTILYWISMINFSIGSKVLIIDQLRRF